jgi:hypothetical protein
MTEPQEKCPTCGAPAERIEHEVGMAKGGYEELRYAGRVPAPSAPEPQGAA